jgi:hypothetical protein
MIWPPGEYVVFRLQRDGMAEVWLNKIMEWIRLDLKHENDASVSTRAGGPAHNLPARGREARRHPQETNSEISCNNGERSEAERGGARRSETETDVDCGGTQCLIVGNACGDGSACNSTADCSNELARYDNACSTVFNRPS